MPYFVPNVREWDHQVLRDSSASARAAYLLDPEDTQWEATLADAVGPDSLSQDRTVLREYLLGPVYADPLEPWQAALAGLVQRAEAEWPDAEAEAGAAEAD